mmetsp:Transcript_27113/g.43596  ORF Transcript_27113/g.43596 Transcript_27113/m.43596 type:complete len:151 (+) Transcript_27113:106-558(+)|eukprot:jgi/Bigna1/85150/estExt_fgenesh1_pg.C_20310
MWLLVPRAGSHGKHIADWFDVTHCQDIVASPQQGAMPRQILWMFYEDMIQDPAREIQRLASFLGIQCTESRAYKIASLTSFETMRKAFESEFNSKDSPLRKRMNGRHFRSGRPGEGVGVLSDSQQREIIASTSALLMPRGDLYKKLFGIR